METGNGLSDIEIHSLLDCSEYRNNLKLLYGINPNKRPTTVALDLPLAEFKGNVSRDEWIAKMISKILKYNLNAKILVVLGNNHILKKLVKDPDDTLFTIRFGGFPEFHCKCVKCRFRSIRT